MKTETVCISHSTSEKNENRVPVKTWKTWALSARYVFNDLYSSMVYSKLWLSRSLAEKITPQELKVAAWNAAWLAADAVMEAYLGEK